MANPTTRAELITHCLRRLGEPVLEVNVDEDQIEDRVDEALQFYQEYHSDAIVKNYYKYAITAADVTNEYVTLPTSVTTVQRIFPIDSSASSNNMFSARYQLRLNDIYDLGFIGSLAHYEQTQQYLSMLDMKLNGAEQVRFNRNSNRLYIDVDWSADLPAGKFIIIDCMSIIDPQTHTEVYNDLFLKRYTTALIKRQWGQNLSKFEGMQLPGGVRINGRQYLEEANAEIDKIEEEMQLKYEAMPEFYVG